MLVLPSFLALSTVTIFAVTIIVFLSHGANWPAVAVADILEMNWRSQFDIDFIIYLLLAAAWISWREGFTLKGHIYGILSVVLGGMFMFPYLLVASYKANGDVKEILLGCGATRRE